MFHLGTQDLIIILLRHVSLFHYFYLLEISRFFYLLASLANAISGRTEIVEWKLAGYRHDDVQEIERCSFI